MSGSHDNWGTGGGGGVGATSILGLGTRDAKWLAHQGTVSPKMPTVSALRNLDRMASKPPPDLYGSMACPPGNITWGRRNRLQQQQRSEVSGKGSPQRGT